MAEQDQMKVVVTDIRMPFWSMVTFMVKLVIASIPAYLILLALVGLTVLIFGGLLAGLGVMAE